MLNLSSLRFLSFQIDALSEIAAAVNGKCEVYVDGGITCGTDVLKALALGAKAVFIGRAALWGLACDVRFLEKEGRLFIY